MNIDRDLQDRIRKHPDAVDEIALCCKVSAAVADADLARCGFAVTERQIVADECFIHGRIKLGEIEKLSSLGGIDTASSAPEAEISTASN